jgi:peptidyl-prolyl cis-trans isomerase A (cyclophilin A)
VTRRGTGGRPTAAPGRHRTTGRAAAVALPALLTVLACTEARAQAPSDPASLAAADSFVVRFETTRGAVDLMVRREWAPLGAVQFGLAVADGYYDGAAFFRALRGFVVQWGIAADPAMTAKWRDRRIADDPATQSNRRGTVTFASGGPNTRTVQLFVNLRDNARLDAMGFPPIGEVVRGMEVVDALHTGYGEGAPAGRGPSQDRLTSEGEPYLAREFPQLDRIRTARIVQVFGGR